MFYAKIALDQSANDAGFSPTTGPLTAEKPTLQNERYCSHEKKIKRNNRNNTPPGAEMTTCRKVVISAGHLRRQKCRIALGISLRNRSAVPWAIIWTRSTSVSVGLRPFPDLSYRLAVPSSSNHMRSGQTAGTIRSNLLAIGRTARLDGQAKLFWLAQRFGVILSPNGQTSPVASAVTRFRTASAPAGVYLNLKTAWCSVPSTSWIASARQVPAHALSVFHTYSYQPVSGS